MDPGIHLLRQGVEKAAPIALRQPIHELLCLLQVRNVGKAIVSLGVANPSPVHLARQPFASVEANLNRERQPSLQSDMHQAKLAVLIVVIKVQALSFLRKQFQMLRRRIFLQVKRLPWLDTSKDTDQTFSDPLLLPNLQPQFFFRYLRRLQVLVGSSQFAGSVLGLLYDPFATAFPHRPQNL